MIIECNTEKVSHFIMPLKSMHNKSLCFNKQKCIFEHCRDIKLRKNLYFYNIFQLFCPSFKIFLVLDNENNFFHHYTFLNDKVPELVPGFKILVPEEMFGRGSNEGSTRPPPSSSSCDSNKNRFSTLPYKRFHRSTKLDHFVTTLY
jgi:hypothetical protein